MSERHFQLVLVAQPFTCTLPARIQCLTRHKPLKLFFFGLHEANLYNFEMAIGDFSLTLTLANGCNFTTSFAQAFQHANDIHSRHYE